MKRLRAGAAWCLLSVMIACERAEAPGTAADTAGANEGMVAAASDTMRTDTVHVVLREWSVRPARESLPAGRVLFHVMNEGKYEHALEVEGGGEEEETEHIRPGQSATLEMRLKPGTYELYCPVEDERGKHQERGMRATLAVR